MVVVTVTLRPRSHCGGPTRNNKTQVGKNGTLRSVWSSKKQNPAHSRRIHQKHPLGNCWWRRKLPRLIVSGRRWTLVSSWVYLRSSLLGRDLLAREFRTRRTLGSILNCRSRFRPRYYPRQLGSLYCKTISPKRDSTGSRKHHPLMTSNTIEPQ